MKPHYEVDGINDGQFRPGSTFTIYYDCPICRWRIYEPDSFRYAVPVNVRFYKPEELLGKTARRKFIEHFTKEHPNGLIELMIE